MSSRGGWGDGTLTDIGQGKWKLRLPPYLGRGQVTFRAVNKTEAKKQQRKIIDEAYRERFDPRRPTATFDELCDYVLGRYRDMSSMSTIRTGLRTARERFGAVQVSDVTHDMVQELERELRAKHSAWTVSTYMQAVKTVLNDAVRRGLIERSPARDVKNPTPKPSQINPFERLDEVEAVAAEMPPAWRALPMFACVTGLRVEEWLALERGDIRDGFIYVNKRFTSAGVFKPGTKNGDPERRVPLVPLAVEALRHHPVRVDTKLLFPHKNGGYLNYTYWHRTVWENAVVASGVQRRRPKDMRHTFATWQLTGNCNLWHLSKVMGTGVKNLERTYGRWIPGSEQVVLAAMDMFVGRQTAAK